MSKPNSPWSIKGVSEEARKAARVAADGDGMTIGAWLDRQIRRAAGSAAMPPAETAAFGADIDAIAQLLDRLKASEARAAETVAPLQAAVDRLLRRLEALESHDASSARVAGSGTPG